MTMPEQHSGPGSGVSAPAAREPPAMRPPPPPPPLSAPWTPLRPTLRGDIVVQATGVMLQLMIARKQWSRASTFEASLVPTLSLAYFISFLIFMTVRPKAYWRHRTWLLPLHMVGLALTPWHNRVDAALGLLLAQPPQPGAINCVRDVLRIAAGTRGITFMLWSIFAMHPPLAALLAHLALAALAWNPLYCTTAALAAPLARQRQAALAKLLDALCMPLVAVQPIVGQLLTSFEDDRALCMATTGWFHLLVQLLAPLLYNVWLWRPPPPHASTAAAAADGPLASCSGLAGQLQQVAAVCNRALHQALGGGAGWPVRLAVAYYVLANAWLICRA